MENQTVYEFVKEKSFEDVKLGCADSNIRVRELKATEQSKKLYLLVSNDFTNESLLHMTANGVIFEKDTNKLVCASQFRTFENANLETLNECLKAPDSKHFLDYADDGTMIRVYNYEGKWFTATTRCIDGEYSYWQDHELNFKKLFQDAFDEEMYSKLDPKFTYCFLLCHPLNRLVVKHETPHVVYISRISNDTKLESFEDVLGLKRPELVKVDQITNMYTFQQRVLLDDEQVLVDETVSCNVDIQDNLNWVEEELNELLEVSFHNRKKGILFVKYDPSSKVYKRFLYETSMYKMFKELKGNTPNIALRYIQLILSNTHEAFMFKTLFEEHNSLLLEIDSKLARLTKEILSLYIKSHVKHEYQVDDTHKFFRTMKQLHAIYRKTRQPIRQQQVGEWLRGMKPETVMRLLEIPIHHKQKKILKRRETQTQTE